MFRGGVDAGGLTREALRLALQELTDTKTGLFVASEERVEPAWRRAFLPADAPVQLELFGTLLGLVLRHQSSAPVAFSRLFLRRLLKKTRG